MCTWSHFQEPCSRAEGIGGKPTVKRVAVVCPTSLVKNWAAEIVKWLGDRLDGAPAQVQSPACIHVRVCHIAPHARSRCYNICETKWVACMYAIHDVHTCIPLVINTLVTCTLLVTKGHAVGEKVICSVPLCAEVIRGSIQRVTTNIAHIIAATVRHSTRVSCMHAHWCTS